MKRLLLVKMTSLGDVIHNLPIVNDIHRNFPLCKIDWVVETPFADIPALHPNVNEIFAVRMRQWRKRLWHPSTIKEIYIFRKKLKEAQYDAIIDTQGLIKSATIALWAKGKRMGYHKTCAREKWASLFYHQTFVVERNQHAVQRNRQLAAKALDYLQPRSAPDYGIDHCHTRPPGLNGINLDQKYVVFLHGTSRDSKLWPEESWVTLGEQINKDGIQILLPWGNNAEQARAESIAAQLPGAHVLPALTISQIAHILKRAQGVAGVDTGLVHLAAALNAPTVAIFTDTNPQLTGVYGKQSEIAINLGDKNKPPAAADVLQTLRHIMR